MGKGGFFKMRRLRIFACSTAKEFSEEICKELSIELGNMEIIKFDNDNKFIRILETVRDDDVFVIQTSMPPVDENLMELLITIDALKRASAGRITAVMPYYPYVRSDKKDQPRVPITARLVADLLTAAGADRVLTCDLHSAQIQGFFKIPLDHLTAVNLLCDYIKSKSIDNLVVVATDAGSSKKAYKYAKILHAPIAMLDKRRMGNEQEVEIEHVIGDVERKNVVIFDDEIDRASSVKQAVEILIKYNVGDIYVGCTHPVFSGPAIERLKKLPIKEIIVTNTIPVPSHKRLPNMKILSIAPLFAQAIKRIHYGQSIGKLLGETK